MADVEILKQEVPGLPALERNFTSVTTKLPLDGLKADPNLWGSEEAAQEVERFLREEYDETIMPRLVGGDVIDREGVWLLGWDHEGTIYPPLMVHLFGPDYSEARLAIMRMYRPVSPNGSTFGQMRALWTKP